MPNWVDVFKEIQTQQSSVDAVRKKYIKKLHYHTKRNIIIYYSGFMHRSGPGLEINDLDLNGFMSTVHKLKCSIGLDLILHTPGGSLSAAEHIIQYLKSKFGANIRVIIPQMAMSAGTMMACAASSIVMGRQSCIGPIDPQFSGISAYYIIGTFTQARIELEKNPASREYWKIMLSKYPPMFVDMCLTAVDRSKELVTDWLKENMLRDKPRDEISALVQNLAEQGRHKGHDQHISKQQAVSLGLVVEELEDDPVLQDLVLTVHHAFMYTLQVNPIVKAFENHLGNAMFNMTK